MPRIVVDSDSEEENANDTNHIDSEESGSDQSDQDSGAGPQEAPAKKAEAQGSWVHLYAEKVKKALPSCWIRATNWKPTWLHKTRLH